MKNLVLIFVLFLICNLVFAEKLQLQAEKLITDYNGIVTNGSMTLCYGDFGIITYSDDNVNWHQKSIGTEHIIKKIKTENNVFYGVTSNSLIKSVDNGVNWIFQKLDGIPEIISMDLNNEKIFILTKENILTTNFQFDNPTVFTQLTPDSVYSEIAINDKYIFVIEGKEKILRFDITNGSLTKSINIKDLEFSPKFSYLSNLKVIENQVYVVIQVEKMSIMPLGTDNYNFYNKLIKSSNHGIIWDLVSDSLKGTSCYNKINGDIYFIGPRPLGSKMRIDFKKLITETKSPELVNDLDIISRDIYYNNYQYNYKINEIIKFSDNVWMAAGNDKMILKTTNAGKNWEIVSFFNTFYIDNLETNVNVLQISKDIVFVPYFRKFDTEIYFNGFLKTMNGGVTWLPQKYDAALKIPAQISQYIFNKEGKGVCLFNYNKTQLFSTDYGETFQIRLDSISSASFQLSDRRSLNLGDRFLFKYTDSKDNNNFTKLYTTDFEKLIDSIVVDSVSFKNLMLAEDSSIYSVGLFRSDFEPPDSVFQYGHYKYQKYIVYKSEDKGKTWTKHSNELPFDVEKIPYNKGWHYYDFSRAATYFNGKIIIPYAHYQGNSLFCIYDISSKQADSVVLNNDYANSKDVFFVFGNRLCYFSLDNRLNYSPENQINSEWGSTNNQDEKIIDDVFISASSDNENCFLTTGKFSFSSNFGGSGYYVNVIKLVTEDYTSVDGENKSEIDDSKINVQPYPLPSSNGWINLQITGINSVNINDIEIFDNKGNQLNSPQIELLQSDSENKILRWNYINFPSGIYYINLGYGIKKISVPVIISK